MKEAEMHIQSYYQNVSDYSKHLGLYQWMIACHVWSLEYSVIVDNRKCGEAKICNVCI